MTTKEDKQHWKHVTAARRKEKCSETLHMNGVGPRCPAKMYCYAKTVGDWEQRKYPVCAQHARDCCDVSVKEADYENAVRQQAKALLRTVNREIATLQKLKKRLEKKVGVDKLVESPA